MEPAAITLNWVDLALVGIVLLSMLLGFVSGLMMQLVGFLSLAIGIGASLYAGPVAATMLSAWLSSGELASFVGSIACFLCAAFLVRILAAVLKGMWKQKEEVKVQLANRLLGSLFGGAKGLFLGAILLVLAGYAAVPGIGEPVRGSVSGAVVLAVTDVFTGWANDPAVAGKSREAAQNLFDRLSDIRRKAFSHEKEGSAPERPARQRNWGAVPKGT
ncbi:MAG: CvpA family protein [Planctomycetota bacterium]